MEITVDVLRNRYREALIELRDAAIEATRMDWAVLLSHLVADLTGNDSDEID